MPAKKAAKASKATVALARAWNEMMPLCHQARMLRKLSCRKNGSKMTKSELESNARFKRLTARKKSLTNWKKIGVNYQSQLAEKPCWMPLHQKGKKLKRISSKPLR